MHSTSNCNTSRQNVKAASVFCFSDSWYSADQFVENLADNEINIQIS